MADKPESLPVCQNLVTKKDAAGNTYRAAECVYQGKTLPHPPEFQSVDKVLKQLQDFKIRADDIWLLDYGKSGTHWTLSILQYLLGIDSGDVPLIGRKVMGMMEMSTDLDQLEKVPSPRILNTHMRKKLIPDKLLEKNKIIMVVRNPKSVAVSWYYHMQLPFSQYKGTFHDYLPLFMDPYYKEFYGSWFDYMSDYWKAFKGKPNVHFVFYEELKKEPAKVIKAISEFLGCTHDQEFIQDIVEKTSFAKLKETQADKMQGTIFGPIANAMFRKGITTDWKNHFSEEENTMFDAVYEKKMKDLPDLKNRISFS